MGRFIYNETTRTEIEDRALFHLQQVITAKLRRGEAFQFTWREDVSLGSGRTTVWVHPAANIVFKFHGSRSPSMNRAWVEALTTVASSNAGLHLVPEPAESLTAASALRG